MEYISLYRKFVDPKFDYHKEYQNLFYDTATIHFDLKIHDNPAFIHMNNEMIKKVENIYMLNNKIVKLVRNNRELPPLVELSILNHSLIEEIHVTNAMEGVISTRKELMMLMNEEPPKKYKRLFGMIHKYQEIVNISEFEKIENSQDLRNLYNKIMIKDIENEDSKNLPDGIIFRKGSVDVTSDGKVIHTGMNPEENIIQYIDKSLNILNDNRLCGLVQIAIFHYLFGYIHPFYDGNGRMARFISSYYLSQYIDSLCALQLSIACKNNQKKYYEGFKITNDIRNKGDLTYYVLNFLEIMESRLQDFMESISTSIHFYLHYKHIIDKKETNDKYEIKILQLLLQNKCFVGEEFTINDFIVITSLAKDTIKKRLNTLERKHMITVNKSQKAYQYAINIDALE